MRGRPEAAAAYVTEVERLRARVEALEDALQRIYWLGCHGEVEEIIIGVLPPERRAEWAKAHAPRA